MKEGKSEKMKERRAIVEMRPASALLSVSSIPEPGVDTNPLLRDRGQV